MMFFSNRTGLERIGGRSAGPGLLWTGPKALDRQAGDRTAAGLACRHRCYSPLQKQERKKGRRGLCPWPLRCLSQFLSKRKERLLRGRMCCVPFTDRVAWYL